MISLRCNGKWRAFTRLFVSSVDAHLASPLPPRWRVSGYLNIKVSD